MKTIAVGFSAMTSSISPAVMLSPSLPQVEMSPAPASTAVVPADVVDTKVESGSVAAAAIVVGVASGSTDQPPEMLSPRITPTRTRTSAARMTIIGWRLSRAARPLSIIRAAHLFANIRASVARTRASCPARYAGRGPIRARTRVPPCRARVTNWS